MLYVSINNIVLQGCFSTSVSEWQPLSQPKCQLVQISLAHLMKHSTLWPNNGQPACKLHKKQGCKKELWLLLQIETIIATNTMVSTNFHQKPPVTNGFMYTTWGVMVTSRFWTTVEIYPTFLIFNSYSLVTMFLLLPTQALVSYTKRNQTWSSLCLPYSATDLNFPWP